MILFSRHKIDKDPATLAESLLNEMYPANEFDDLETLNLYANGLKKCSKSFLPLSKYDKNILKELLEERFIFHSSLIENNTVSKEGVQSILRENKVIPNISLREHLEILNQKEALDYLEECLSNNQDLGREVLFNTHYLILKSIDTKNAGTFRKCNATIFSSDYKPPKPKELDEQMYKYFQYYNQNLDKLDTIILASDMHAKLCLIKPFTDGNGIVARLLMNYILMKNDYPLLNIQGTRENKIKYFQALEEFPRKPELFYKFITLCAVKSLIHYIKSIILLAPRYKGEYFYEELTRKCGIDKRDKLFSLLSK